MRHRLLPACLVVASLAGPASVPVAVPVAAQAPTTAELRARIDSIVTSMMGPTGAPGISIAVVRGSETIALEGCGEADIENGVPVTDRSMVFAVEDGRATSFTLHQAGAEIVARRIE